MKRTLIAGVLCLFVTMPLAAQNGAHFNLNIIGVDQPKNSTMTSSDRHTIFVGLGRKSGDTPKRGGRGRKRGSR